MANETGELAGKVNGVIPFFFFDLIARVAPGLLLLFGINYVSEKQVNKAILAMAFNDQIPRDSPGAWITVLLVAGYILGHGISPIVKLLDKRNRRVSQQYNDLRLKFPGVTPIAMRIRAEYIMYGGFAVSLTIVAGVGVLQQARNALTASGGVRVWWNSASLSHHLEAFGIFVILIVLAWLMLYRNQETIDTYQNTVRELHRAAGLSPVGIPADAEGGRIRNLVDLILFRNKWIQRLFEKMIGKGLAAPMAKTLSAAGPAVNSDSLGPHPS